MFRFVREAFRDIRNTGSVWPSSPALARAMTKGLKKIDGHRRVLEIGAGTGPFTERILRHLRAGDRFDIVEMNAAFCSSLERRLLAPFRSRRSGIPVVLHESSIERAQLDGPYDLIVCGLPFNNFPPSLVRSIFRTMLSLLREGGELAYFEYAGVRTLKAPLVGSGGRKRLKGIATVGKSLRRQHQGVQEFVLTNIPPALATRLCKSNGVVVKRKRRTKSKRKPVAIS